jgi:hypothetical protein
MTRWLFFWFVGTVISALSLLGFIFAAGVIDTQLKFLSVPIYVFATVFLFIMASHRLDKGSLTRLACAIAFSSVCVEQLIALSFFPGLVKDLAAFEWAHLKRLVLAFCLALIWYFTVAIAASAVTWKQASRAQ